MTAHRTTRHRTAARLTALTAAAALGATLIVACGGDDDTAATTDPPPTEAPATDPPPTEAPTTDPPATSEVDHDHPELVWQVTYTDESGSPSEPRSIAVSPDGETVAIGYFLTANTHRIADGELIAEFEFGHSVDDLVFTPDGEWFAGAATRGGWWLHPINEPTEPIRLEDSPWEGRLDISPDGLTIAGGRDLVDSILLWSVADGSLVDSFERPSDQWFDNVQYHPGGEIIAVSDQDCEIAFIDATTGAVIDLLEHPDGRCAGYQTRWFSFSPDGTTLARHVSPDWDHAVELIDLATGVVTRTIPLDARIQAIAFSHDNTMIALVTQYEAAVYDLATGEPIHVIEQTFDPDESDWNTDVLFTVDDEHLLIRRWNLVELWRLPGAGELPTS